MSGFASYHSASSKQAFISLYEYKYLPPDQEFIPIFSQYAFYLVYDILYHDSVLLKI